MKGKGIMEYPVKRSLDGVYYRVKRNGEWLNICYSDLTQEERDSCTAKYTLAQMKGLADLMADALRHVGDTLNVIASFPEDEAEQSGGETHEENTDFI